MHDSLGEGEASAALWKRARSESRKLKYTIIDATSNIDQFRFIFLRFGFDSLRLSVGQTLGSERVNKALGRTAADLAEQMN